MLTKNTINNVIVENYLKTHNYNFIKKTEYNLNDSDFIQNTYFFVSPIKIDTVINSLNAHLNMISINLGNVSKKKLFEKIGTKLFYGKLFYFEKESFSNMISLNSKKKLENLIEVRFFPSISILNDSIKKNKLPSLFIEEDDLNKYKKKYVRNFLKF